MKFLRDVKMVLTYCANKKCERYDHIESGKFCTMCGKPTKEARRCKKCDTQACKGDKFCSDCGAEL